MKQMYIIMERHGSTVHIMHENMTVSHAGRIAEEDQAFLFFCYFVFLLFFEGKGEAPLSSSGMVLKVVLGNPQTRYYRIRWLIF
jgi:hypothetical protein